MNRLDGKAWCDNCRQYVEPVKDTSFTMGIEEVILGAGAGAILGSSLDPHVGAFFGGMTGLAVTFPGTWMKDRMSLTQVKWLYITWFMVLVFGSITLWAKTCPEYIWDSFVGPKCSGFWGGLNVN